MARRWWRPSPASSGPISSTYEAPACTSMTFPVEAPGQEFQPLRDPGSPGGAKGRRRFREVALVGRQPFLWRDEAVLRREDEPGDPRVLGVGALLLEERRDIEVLRRSGHVELLLDAGDEEEVWLGAAVRRAGLRQTETRSGRLPAARCRTARRACPSEGDLVAHDEVADGEAGCAPGVHVGTIPAPPRSVFRG